ncbi:dipeptide ABC transporter ATP-binding protein [Brevibacillus composti]|uniref:Dipeptide ABC transporter ATP-binding protein n=1 Tax=Brevibacillus composti TaxID=2796470 RepID=A0A7T5EMW5_9BACL|nr:dipeptide ABC transporter ATP-binding protein [Brevibacillus composti]QQE75502.1 dipeptide ABC transporter ATP-binding protein [Brevibacillus composti]QUO42528.1 dipeptide ABC transporter ATP-binding protein [Brevibacillus composti]
MAEALLEVRDLKKYFPIKGKMFKPTTYVKAVDGVSFTIQKGETVGLVGESGCGKSTTGRALLHLLPPTGGEVIYKGKDLTSLSAGELRLLRRELQIVFQDPYASLDPRMKIRDVLLEPLEIHRIGSKQERLQMVEEILDIVGLGGHYANRYPHEFSGGQRQRIGIARSLILRPSLIVADEPVSALDVSIQSQILNLLQDLQEQFDLTYLFISHDLSVVKHISDRVGVMYLGRLVEFAPKEKLYASPAHPYTQALLSAAPVANPDAKPQRIILTGDVPSPANPPSGCAFHTRCPYVMDKCKTDRPELAPLDGEGHLVACHLHQS